MAEQENGEKMPPDGHGRQAVGNSSLMVTWRHPRRRRRRYRSRAGPGCRGLDPAASWCADLAAVSVEVFPAPGPGWAAVSLPAEPEPILLLLAEDLEHACPWQPFGQCDGRLPLARCP
jgi:hypothetical protein